MDKFDEKIIGYVEMVDWVSPEFSARAYSDQPEQGAPAQCALKCQM